MRLIHTDMPTCGINALAREGISTVDELREAVSTGRIRIGGVVGAGKKSDAVMRRIIWAGQKPDDAPDRDIHAEFITFAQKRREFYGAMDDTAPLLWDIGIWLKRKLKSEDAA